MMERHMFCVGWCPQRLTLTGRCCAPQSRSMHEANQKPPLEALPRASLNLHSHPQAPLMKMPRAQRRPGQ